MTAETVEATTTTPFQILCRQLEGSTLGMYQSPTGHAERLLLLLRLQCAACLLGQQALGMCHAMHWLPVSHHASSKPSWKKCAGTACTATMNGSPACCWVLLLLVR
jgi:hypothetical protein